MSTETLCEICEVKVAVTKTGPPLCKRCLKSWARRSSPDTKSLSTRGTEQKGRAARPPLVVAEQRDADDS